MEKFVSVHLVRYGRQFYIRQVADSPQALSISLRNNAPGMYLDDTCFVFGVFLTCVTEIASRKILLPSHSSQYLKCYFKVF